MPTLFFSQSVHPISFLSFQIGHVNKTGDIAGPHLLEHIVDVVLYMEVG
jgi:predicted ATP-dependent serine protease